MSEERDISKIPEEINGKLYCPKCGKRCRWLWEVVHDGYYAEGKSYLCFVCVYDMERFNGVCISEIKKVKSASCFI